MTTKTAKKQPNKDELIETEKVNEQVHIEKDAPEVKGVSDAAASIDSKAMEWLMMVPTPVMVVGKDFTVEFMNEVGASVVNKTPKECLGKKCYNLFNTGDCNTEKCAVYRAMKEDGVFTSETVAKLPGGDLPIRYTGTPCKNKKGEIIGALEYVTDMTEVKEVMDESLLKVDYLNSIPTPVMAVDKNMNVIFMNPAGAAAVNMTPDTCLGKKCADLFNTGDCNTEKCAVYKAMNGDGVFTSETTAKLPSGDLPIRYTGTPLKNQDGTIIGALEYVTDMTEVKEVMDESLQKVEYLNSIPTPVMAVDNNMNVVFMNPAGATAVNMTPDSCLGKKCYDLFHADDCNTENCAITRAMKENAVITRETTANLPGGALPIRYTGAPLKDELGNLIGGLEYVLDISGEIGAVNGILEMVEAATKGNLSNRADVDQYDGNFLKIIDGINSLLDAIVEPINETSDVLAKLADNDLTFMVEGDYQGDLAKIKNAVNTVIDSLTKLVSQIKNNADNLATASDQLSRASEQAGQATQQIAATSQQVAKGASEQSTALQQTSEGIEQLSKAIQQISKGSQTQAQSVERNVEIVNQVSTAVTQVTNNAQVAAEGSQKAGEAARKGSDMAQQTVQGMEKIKDTMGVASGTVQNLGEQSNEIGKIVATIDDIAAQTNLLALNAAIEAARAGEQGRGFAVVADEVRKLAERSSAATKEIADLISNIQKGVEEAVKAMADGNNEVDSGYKLATDAGESLEDILRTVQEVSTEVERISAASEELNALSTEMVQVTDDVSSVVEENTAATEEMAASADQVTKSVESVAGVAEENSASTEEVSASAEEMSAQVEEVVASAQSLAAMSEELQNNVAIFKIRENAVER